MEKHQIVEDVKKGSIKVVDRVKSYLEKIEKDNTNINAFYLVDKKGALDQAATIDAKIAAGEKIGKLAGLIFGIKSCIAVKGLPCTCGSKTLENYESPYDADVIVKLREHDAVILGMLNMDEFASGNTGESCAYGSTKNPKAPDYVPGGSSSGSAASVAADFVDVALGTDTGGSVRNPASHCGVVGLKPSWGRVSRYGLVDLSMSLDQIGVLAKDVDTAALVLGVIAGESRNDAITRNEPVEIPTTDGKGMRLGISPELMKLTTDKRILDLVERAIEQYALECKGAINEVSLSHINLAVQTYYPLVYTEFFSGTRKFDGRRYGKVIEESCGVEVLRRILGGKEISKSEYDGTYYRKALATKKLIAKEINEAFNEVDVIVSPVTPNLPKKLGEPQSVEDCYAEDAMTVCANLSEICGGVVPIGEIDGVPIGIQILAPVCKEDILIRVMRSMEQIDLASK